MDRNVVLFDIKLQSKLYYNILYTSFIMLYNISLLFIILISIHMYYDV